jgi:ribonuclease P protein component
VKRKFRLCQFTEFKRVRRLGKSFAHPLVVLVVLQSSLPGSRIGVVAGKAVGNAVRRNRVRRQMRSCLDKTLPDLKGGWDFILMARKPMSDASFIEIHSAIQNVIRRAGLIETRTTVES